MRGERGCAIRRMPMYTWRINTMGVSIMEEGGTEGGVRREGGVRGEGKGDV